MSKILYGAAVQGIQGFIFQTNKLKDIIGASELVEKVCTSAFAEQAGTDIDSLHRDKNMIVMAAGNILYIFEDEDKCRDMVLYFPKKVMEMAPGITISQAAVCMDGKFSDFAKASEELQRRLQIQRNRPQRPVAPGMIGMIRSRQTGFPAVIRYGGEQINEKFTDIATYAKKKSERKVYEAEKKGDGLSRKNFGDHALNSMRTVRVIDELTGKNDWIAIVHADGNGLGQIVQKIAKDAELYKAFSSSLNTATVLSAQEAFKALENKFRDDAEVSGDASAAMPKIQIRPIVLNGDDHTVIIRGDLAVGYAEEFLRAFEKNTKQEFARIKSSNPAFHDIAARGLTACAGIAFIKSSFPFYFGYAIAEDLCSYAKKCTKKLASSNALAMAPSCLMFHKVQDSFVEDYDEIAARELTPNSRISFRFGPYYLEEERDGAGMKWTVGQLLEIVQKLNSSEGKAVKTHLRQWANILYKENGIEKGAQLIQRLMSLTTKSMAVLVDRCCTGNTSPVYDIMALSSVIYQETN